MCSSTRWMSPRGVNSTASAKAAGRTGHVGYGGVKPTSANGTASRLAISSAPTVGLGISRSCTTLRNRSAAVLTAEFFIRCQDCGRQATTQRVREATSRRSMRPFATRSNCRSSRTPGESSFWYTRLPPYRATNASIWSTATTLGPVSASSRNRSPISHCGGLRSRCWIPQPIRSPGSVSSRPCRYAYPTSCAWMSREARSTNARTVS